MSTLTKKMKSIPKGYFTVFDVRKITKYSLSTTRVMLHRLAERGEIIRLEKGVYCVDAKKVDFWAYACERYAPSYISFETALSIHNILSQKTFHITLATTNRTYKKSILEQEMNYHHIDTRRYWGYKRVGGYLLAEPEKAFLDLLYLSLRGWAVCDTQEMNLSFLDKKKTFEYVKRCNVPYMEKRVKQIL
jgi:predicted transcriptional regulator of viral defense system